MTAQQPPAGPRFPVAFKAGLFFVIGTLLWLGGMLAVLLAVVLYFSVLGGIALAYGLNRLLSRLLGRDLR